MSSYSFSQYFYQRWTCAPEPVRATITQELEDITTLLQTETPFESFVFNTHDLDAHIDELYENHEAEQAIAKAISDKQEEEQAAIEQKRLDDEQKAQAIKDAKEKEEADRLETAKTVQEESEKNALPSANTASPAASVAAAANEVDKINTDSHDSDDSQVADIADSKTANSNSRHTDHKTISEHAHTMSQSDPKNADDNKSDNIKAIHGKASAAISLALKDTKLSTEHQSLIHELERQIDDYLSEQMMLISEDLKSWLRAEVTQHLGAQDKAVTDEQTAENTIESQVH
ncbi:hypothetical protein [Psychrobacter sp. B38]|uniref:hypothetical protein n=1 Tax=Psychrobacter sp. B38 TaxID=3143538 RepID=UPI003211B110